MKKDTNYSIASPRVYVAKLSELNHFTIILKFDDYNYQHIDIWYKDDE